jgi:DNA-binding winged helix-turn-helix (wHTH) protein
MHPTDRSPRLLRFGVFEVDLREGELRRKGQKIKLQERPFQFLAALLERPGEVIAREELARKLWADVVVDVDSGLNRAARIAPHAVRFPNRALDRTDPRRG